MALYHKKFATNLVPHLVNYFNALRHGSYMDIDSNRAFISFIAKPIRGPSNVANCRPISLINCDLKLLEKIYATKLNSFKARYVHEDQVGFIPDRQASDQIRRAINLLSVLAPPGTRVGHEKEYCFRLTSGKRLIPSPGPIFLGSLPGGTLVLGFFLSSMLCLAIPQLRYV